MKYIDLGDLTVSRIGLGAMSMSHGYAGAGSDDDESVRTIHRALDLGIDFVHRADIDGAWALLDDLDRSSAPRRIDGPPLNRIPKAHHDPPEVGVTPAGRLLPVRLACLHE